jgi:hypothetical protein
MSQLLPSARGNEAEPRSVANQEAECTQCDKLLEGHMEEANLLAGTLVRKRADPWKIDDLGAEMLIQKLKTTHEWGGEAKR